MKALAFAGTGKSRNRATHLLVVRCTWVEIQACPGVRYSGKCLAPTPNEKTILSRADAMFSPQGMIGQCVVGTNDLVSRMPKRTLIFHYENFTRDPAAKMREFYEFMEMDNFEHNFDSVKNVSEDVDALYHHKFPHQGEGKIEPTNRDEYKEFVPQDLSQSIFNRYPDYNKNCGYQ